jgi:hypothetical protein
MNRAMLRPMLLHGCGPWPPGTALLAVADDLASASAAVLGGADLVDLTAAPTTAINEFRRRHPGILVCAAGPPADVVRDRLLVDVLPAMLPEITQAGLAALVDVDRAAALAAALDADPVGPAANEADMTGPDVGGAGGADASAMAGVVAMAALSSWLGASAVRTRHVVPVRRALDMTATIRGIRPPALTVRGLA